MIRLLKLTSTSKLILGIFYVIFGLAMLAFSTLILENKGWSLFTLVTLLVMIRLLLPKTDLKGTFNDRVRVLFHFSFIYILLSLIILSLSELLMGKMRWTLFALMALWTLVRLLLPMKDRGNTFYDKLRDRFEIAFSFHLIIMLFLICVDVMLMFMPFIFSVMMVKLWPAILLIDLFLLLILLWVRTKGILIVFIISISITYSIFYLMDNIFPNIDEELLSFAGGGLLIIFYGVAILVMFWKERKEAAKALRNPYKSKYFTNNVFSYPTDPDNRLR